MSHVHAVVGPTGVGKTELATALAREMNAPIVVADRLQCYRELATTSARSEGDKTAGIIRLHLDDRLVRDGDYPPAEASEALVHQLEQLRARHPYVVVEGGSISVLQHFVSRRKELSFDFSAHVLQISDEAEYRHRLFARARSMLMPELGRPGMLRELEDAWRNELEREFVASINGFEAILAWSYKHSFSPAHLTSIKLDAEMLDELTWMVVDAHAEHGVEQQREFCRIFARRPVRNSF
jgi:tRNA A37 N6-isopentenylltransferase MiaA